MLWILTTLIAAAAQTVRNATQRTLTVSLGAIGATHVRFLYGLPFAVAFLIILSLVGGEAPIAPGLTSVAYTALGAVSQIGATALMLLAMQERSFSITTALIKTEPVVTAFAGLLLIGDVLTPPKLAGIALATAGVMVISLRPEQTRGLLSDLRPVVLGIAAGALFGLSAVAFRGAIVELPAGSFLSRATTILVLGLAIQTALIVLYLALADRKALTASLTVWQPSLAAGFLGAVASQFWFIGFALTSAANVRTLALVEVLMAMALSGRLFKERISGREMAGIAVMITGVALVLWSAAR